MKKHYLKWEDGKAVTKYYDVQEGKLCDVPSEGIIHECKNGREEYMVDYIVDTEKNAVAVILYSLDISVPSENMPKIEEYTRFYITESGEVMYYEDYDSSWRKMYINNECMLPFPMSNYPLLNEICSQTGGLDTFYPGEETIKNVLGIIPPEVLDGTKIKKIKNQKDIINYLLQEKPKEKVNLPLITPKKPTVQKNDTHVATLTRANEEYCCLTVFTALANSEYFHELFRIYVSKKEFVSVKVVKGELEPVEFTELMANFTIEEYPKDVVAGTKLCYYTEIIKTIPASKRGRAIHTFIKEPLFESFCKMDHEDIVTYILQQSKYNYETALAHFLGFLYPFYMDRTKKKFNAITMMSANQLSKLCDEFKEASNSEKKQFFECDNTMIILRNAFGKTLFQLSDESYSEMLNLVKRMMKAGLDANSAIMLQECLTIDERLYDKNTKAAVIARLTLFSDEELKNFCTGGLREYHEYLSIVSEYQEDIEQLEMFRGTFTSCENIGIMLNNIRNINEIMKDRERVEQFQNSIMNVSQYTYENDNYKIIMPYGPQDLVYEGNQLNHCVGGYVDRVIKGQTYILFLRRKEAPATPFFTIEISYDGKIEQMHGQSNCNIDSVEGLPEFVDEWCDSKKVKKHNLNKIR